MFKRSAIIITVAFPLVTLAHAATTAEQPVPEQDKDYPKLKTTPIRPKEFPLDEPQFRIPEAQLERLRQESQKDPDLIIPLHIREPKNQGGKR